MFELHALALTTERDANLGIYKTGNTSLSDGQTGGGFARDELIQLGDTVHKRPHMRRI